MFNSNLVDIYMDLYYVKKKDINVILLLKKIYSKYVIGRRKLRRSLA